MRNESIGKQESLKHDFAGYWSRRITMNTAWRTRSSTTK